ncbi:hypothetical protein H0H93_008628 [Arthromyces matolae]|nr:hypothetical protein H0H93_008628 [Arthromyces matolae]
MQAMSSTELCRSLFQSRSLRDFHAPAPSPLRPVEDQSREHRDRLDSEEPISPSTDWCPQLQLRSPCVEPRRYRRLCSDFGRVRNDFQASPSSPMLDFSSLISTPLTTWTHAETASDSDESLEQALDYAFPEPPPFGKTLHLRRMHSSPGFELEEPLQESGLLKKRWGAPGLLSKAPLLRPYSHWNVPPDGASSVASNNSSISTYFPKGQSLSVLSQETNLNSSPIGPRLGGSSSWKRASTESSHKRRSVDPASPRFLDRSRSSARIGRNSSANVFKGSTSIHSNISESMDRLDLSLEKLKVHDPQHGRITIGSNTQNLSNSMPNPSLASAGRKKPAPHGKVSPPAVPPAGERPVTPGPRAVLDRRDLRIQPLYQVQGHRLDPIPKSFMDITPEREVQQGTGTRVRKLFARASMGMLSVLGKVPNRPKSIRR